MDFDQAINAHVGWKMKLGKYLRHVDGSLDPKSIERNDACDLGKWLAGEGKAQCSKHAAFKTLTAEHANFHRAAADIVRKANAGAKVTDETALGAATPFAKASAAVVNSIMELRRLCGG